MKKVLICFLILFSAQIFGQNAAKNDDTRNVFLDISGAYGIRLAKNNAQDDLEKEYVENLRKGFAYEAALYMRFEKTSDVFFGVKYNSFGKKSIINGIVYNDPNGNMAFGELSDDITISYYGVSSMLRKKTTDIKGEFNLEGGLGYIRYVDNVVYGSNKAKITGGNIGLYASGSYYFKITDRFYLGPKVGALIGTLNKMTITEGDFKETRKLEGEDKIDLSRVDLSVSARIKF